MRRLLTSVACAIGLVALGPAAAAAPAQQPPATAAFTASDSPDRWSTAAGNNGVVIALGGTVTFDVATGEPHDVSFPDARGVACSLGGGAPATRIPATPSASWSGSCTFGQPGYIPFVCTVHDAMNGEVTVAAADGSLPPRYPVITAGTAVAEWGPPSGLTPVSGPPPGWVGPSTTALTPVFTFARSQRGTVVRGTIANAGPGATATIDLSARRRDLSSARRKPSGSTRLRRLTRATSAQGKLAVAVTLTGAARRALLRRGRLELTLRATVRGARVASGSATRTQKITLRAPARASAAAR